jgi:hypothetical protein
MQIYFGEEIPSQSSIELKNLQIEEYILTAGLSQQKHPTT